MQERRAIDARPAWPQARRPRQGLRRFRRQRLRAPRNQPLLNQARLTVDDCGCRRLGARASRAGGGVRKKIRAPKRWLGRRIGGAAAFFLHIRDFVCPRGEAKLPLLVGRDIRLPIADWRLGTKPMDGAGRSRRRGGDGFRESWGRGRIARGTQSQRCEVRRKRPLRGEEATYFGRGSCSRRRVLRTAPKCLRRPAGDPAKCTL